MNPLGLVIGASLVAVSVGSRKRQFNAWLLHFNEYIKNGECELALSAYTHLNSAKSDMFRQGEISAADAQIVANSRDALVKTCFKKRHR